ncbi:hypothetical protein [Brevundimonas sp. PAMC22021]|uniref:hypothetical protein n=1 Tax=Brevundimonas sp. PAMC22021 TaxID=2861285 RepID=UPI001C626255|nr:hypothetical protein [Brevundimonas sp. PAMC22021]QYF86206.1 hypothetical protein KY493_10170 [Brevundimonas sp. PAMC22021]
MPQRPIVATSPGNAGEAGRGIMTVTPAATRVERLRQLREAGEVIGSEKLFYKGEPQRFNVYRIDLDLLVYNRHNGRIESEMLTWQFDHDVDEHAYDEVIHKRIADYLWNTNEERNRHTLKDLKEKQQQRPGIVSLDGVIIDGNRRAMLLNRIVPRRHFEAVILPDAYYDDEREIVRLETQYQIGEDSKLDYGPLEKYLKVKRLVRQLDYPTSEVADMMATTKGEVEKWLSIMDLMDDYLEHIGCAGLYTMLKEPSGATKEGMFVDLHLDMKRLDKGTASVPWPTSTIDEIDLRTIQFDYIRFGSGLLDAGKDYRRISHDGRGERTFFAKEDIWRKFRDGHRGTVDVITNEVGELAAFVAANPHFPSMSDAAMARESEWKAKAGGPLQGNFNKADLDLQLELNANEPRKLLERAFAALDKIDYTSEGFVTDTANGPLVKEINTLVYEMKKRLERAERKA